MSRRGAAAVIIGNEVLSAKVQDANGPLLIRRLRDYGMPLRSVCVVPDEVDAIVDAVARARAQALHVFTSGGIGPTHDDVTVRAVALAMGRPVVRLAEMEQLITAHFGDRLTPEAMRLADAPEGSELWTQKGNWMPVLTCGGVYLLPGVPQLFAMQLETVLARLERTPVHLRCLYLSAGEAQIAQVLDRVALSMPQVAIGSYPNFDRSLGYSVKLTLEADDAAPVEGALAWLQRELPQGCILRLE
ncbi:MAG TPA: molybdopterin-binding protein [Myxococcaceae bacterium]|nr:molybdopterin-binding protein [Myxococcaceae bacterium]